MAALVDEGGRLAVKEVGKGHDGGKMARCLLEEGLTGDRVEGVPQVALEEAPVVMSFEAGLDLVHYLIQTTRDSHPILQGGQNVGHG